MGDSGLAGPGSAAVNPSTGDSILSQKNQQRQWGGLRRGIHAAEQREQQAGGRWIGRFTRAVDEGVWRSDDAAQIPPEARLLPTSPSRYHYGSGLAVVSSDRDSVGLD